MNIPGLSKTFYTWTLSPNGLKNTTKLFTKRSDCIKNLLRTEKNSYDDKNKKYIILHKEILKKKYRFYKVRTPQSNINKGTFSTIKNINKAKVDYEEDYLENLLNKYKIEIDIRDIDKIKSERKRLYDKIFSKTKIKVEEIIKKHNLNPGSLSLYTKEYDDLDYEDSIEDFLSGRANYMPLAYCDVTEFSDNPREDYQKFFNIINRELISTINTGNNPGVGIEYSGDWDDGSVDLVVDW